MRNKWRKHMKMHFRKIALATAVSAAMAGMSLSVQANVAGVAGDALLVPLVVWGNSQRDIPNLNTLIEVEIPSDIGHEDVANIFTAPNTTSANDLVMAYDPAVFVKSSVNGDDRPYNAIHWFWFDHRSVHRWDQLEPVTPNDIVFINWRDAAGGAFENQPGYMVIVNEGARDGSKAQFPMFGNAWLVNDEGFPNQQLETEIPVLPLSDGEDVTDYPTMANNVIYAGGIPSKVSPLASGMLLNYADGNLGDYAVFDMVLADLGDFAYHVIWLDDNRGPQNNVGGFSYNVNVDVFDSEERECSTTVNVPHELNIICIDDLPRRGNCPKWSSTDPLSSQPGIYQLSEDLPVSATINLCAPGKVGIPDGYVQYQLKEFTDRGTGVPETAGVAFSILEERTVGAGEDNDIDRETATVRYRGMFRILTN
jgi:hypothetical protein